MPAMGDSVSEGTVLEWHKQEGDQVSEDETLVEISTDKVDAEVPAPAEGTVVKIHAAEGDTGQVGTVLAEIQPGGNGRRRRSPTRASRRRNRGHRHARHGRVGVRGHDPRVGQAARRAGREDETVVEISTDKVDAEVSRPPPDHRGDPRPGRRHRDRRPGDRAHDHLERRHRRREAPEPTAAPRPQASAPPKSPTDQGHAGGGLRPTRSASTWLDPRPGAGGSSRRRAGGRERRHRRARGQAAQGRQRDARARFADESRAIPTATSFRTLTVTALDGRTSSSRRPATASPSRT